MHKGEKKLTLHSEANIMANTSLSFHQRNILKTTQSEMYLLAFSNIDETILIP